MDAVQWSFGVLLWELLTRGAKPYEGVEITRMRRHLKDGNRLAKPSSSTPDFAYVFVFLPAHYFGIRLQILSYSTKYRLRAKYVHRTVLIWPSVSLSVI